MRTKTTATTQSATAEIAQTDTNLFTVAEAARRLGVSVSWMKQNPTALPYVRIGKKLKRWRVQDIDAYIARNVRNAV